MQKFIHYKDESQTMIEDIVPFVDSLFLVKYIMEWNCKV